MEPKFLQTVFALHAVMGLCTTARANRVFPAVRCLDYAQNAMKMNVLLVRNHQPFLSTGNVLCAEMCMDMDAANATANHVHFAVTMIVAKLVRGWSLSMERPNVELASCLTNIAAVVHPLNV